MSRKLLPRMYLFLRRWATKNRTISLLRGEIWWRGGHWWSYRLGGSRSPSRTEGRRERPSAAATATATASAAEAFGKKAGIRADVDERRAQAGPLESRHFLRGRQTELGRRKKNARGMTTTTFLQRHDSK